MKCEFEGSAAQLDAARRVVILRFPHISGCWAWRWCFCIFSTVCPQPKCWENHTGLQWTGHVSPPSLGLPSPDPVTLSYWCFWNNLCVPFLSYLLPCFSLEEPKPGSLRLASALKRLSDHRRDAAADLWALWSSLCPAPTSTFVFKAEWSWRHFCLLLYS